MKIRPRLLGASCLVISVFFLLVSGCGGGGTQPATVDLTGSWEVTETITEASGICAGNVGTVSTWGGDAVQTGNDVDVTVTSGQNVGSQFSGIVSGNHIDWEGSYPSEGGTVTITGTDITATDTTFSGSSNWEWTDGADSCSGQTNVTGNKV